MAISILNAGPATIVAEPSDLPYLMYTPQLDTYTKWDVEWTGSSERAIMEWGGNGWQLNGSEDGIFLGGDETSTHFEGEAPSYGFDTYSATRSLAYGLHERANNLIDATTGNVTLTLPPFVAGKARDLLVRLTVSASSTVTWHDDAGIVPTWDAMGAPPASFAEGTYLYHITEVAVGVWHAEDMLALVGLEAALAAINGGVAS